MGKSTKPPSKINAFIARKAPYRVPTPEELARASAETEKRNEKREQHLETIRTLFVAEFAPLCPLTYFSFGHGPREALRAYIFFRNEADVIRAESSGFVERIERKLFELLESHGRMGEQVILRLKSDESIRRIPGAHRCRRKECEVAGPGIWPDDTEG